MRGIVVLTFAVASLAACGRDDMAATQPPATEPPAPAQPAAENRGVGVVQAVDAANGTLTIAHEPIPELGWPAMTMPFKAEPPELLENVVAGERIEFTLRGRDMSAVVTSINEAE